MCLERGIIFGIVANCTAEALSSNTVDFTNAPPEMFDKILEIQE